MNVAPDSADESPVNTSDPLMTVPGPPLPVVRFEDLPFWTGGADGRLLITRCRSCGWWIHPPRPACRRCRSTDVAPEAASGKAVVYSYTLNHQPWIPGMAVPYLLAVVELVEQPGLRLTTRLTSPPGAVAIGDRAEVRFQQVDDEVWLPLFAVVRTSSRDGST